MSEAPVRKAPVTHDPASAPPQQSAHSQQQQQQQPVTPQQRPDSPRDRADAQHQRTDMPQQREDTSQHSAAPERAAGRLEDEWQAVQYEFVDDPKAAVRKADELVKRAIDELTTRHRSLSQQLEGNGDPQTEDLRLALHRYRELFKSLVAVK
ncbi:hypothetical protein [Lentzea sp. NPDC004782]|uniref:hypothetical protein n=1 Tax=Lentzea sp. NPDC004782 TaxID=3154458 RepID=UPI00339F393A